MNDLPSDLRQRPFTVREAEQRGITRRMLKHPRFRRVHRGIYVDRDLVLTLQVRCRAALLATPVDAVLSHLSAARLHGLDLPGPADIHLSTRSAARTQIPGIVLHRRQAPISRSDMSGLPVTGPLRTFVDCAMLPRHVSFVWLIVLAEWMISTRLTTLPELSEYCRDRHLHGVQRARRVMTYVREGAESPRETILRLALVFARLPEPLCNVDIHDDVGDFLARGDLVYPRWRVVVEYDGVWHERSVDQRRQDRNRHERLEANGWTVIVVHSPDLSDPDRIVGRVHAALQRRGWRGTRPVTSIMWSRWFRLPTRDLETWGPKIA